MSETGEKEVYCGRYQVENTMQHVGSGFPRFVDRLSRDSLHCGGT